MKEEQHLFVVEKQRGPLVVEKQCLLVDKPVTKKGDRIKEELHDHQFLKAYCLLSMNIKKQ